MNRGFRGRARGLRGYVGRGHGQDRAFEAVAPGVDEVDAKEIGVGHGGGITPDPSEEKVVEESVRMVHVYADGGFGDFSDDVTVEKKKDGGDEAKKDGGDERKKDGVDEVQEGAVGGTVDDRSNQTNSQRGGWVNQERGRDRGGYIKRGFGGGGGGRGGRGDGRGNLEHWSEANAPLLPEVPFEYTPWETTFHLEARDFLIGLRDSREGLIRDENGFAYDDCTTNHGYGLLCQFCDGRNGPWVQKDVKPNDPAFLRYQESILRSPFQTSRTTAEADKDYEERRELLKLGVEADEVAEEAEEKRSASLGEDFGLFDRLNLTE